MARPLSGASSISSMGRWPPGVSSSPTARAGESDRGRFDVRKHKTLATVRSDGSPRISGIEVEFAGEHLRSA